MRLSMLLFFYRPYTPCRTKSLKRSNYIMENVTLNVQGMSCGSCGNKVDGSIRKLEGIEDVQVNVASGEVAVVFDKGQIAVAQVVAAIESHAYVVAK